MRITGLELNNFEPFGELKIDFKEKTDPDKAEIHLFTGENGTGKSTILYALASIYQLQPLLQNRFFVGNSFPKSIDIKYDKDQSTLHQKTSGEIKMFHRGNSIIHYANQLYQYQQTKFDFAFFSYSGFRSVENVVITNPTELHENPIIDAIRFHKPVNASQLLQWIVTTKTKEALEIISGNQTKADKHNKTLERIEKIIEQIIEKPVKFNLNTTLKVSIKIGRTETDFDGLPDGLKSMVAWIADLLMRMDRIEWSDNGSILDRNFILFLDEIEVHLHPAWQRKILPQIQKLFKNAQIFISTHSPFVVGSVDGAWVYKLKMVDGKSTIAEVTESKAGDSVSLVLKEIFDIDGEFDIETEKEFVEFYKLKEELLTGNIAHEPEFLGYAKTLADKSLEVRDIVGMEIRQLNRVLNKDYSL